MPTAEITDEDLYQFIGVKTGLDMNQVKKVKKNETVHFQSKGHSIKNPAIRCNQYLKFPSMAQTTNKWGEVTCNNCLRTRMRLE